MKERSATNSQQQKHASQCNPAGDNNYFSNTFHIFPIYTANDITESPAEISSKITPEATKIPGSPRLHKGEKTKKQSDTKRMIQPGLFGHLSFSCLSRKQFNKPAISCS